MIIIKPKYDEVIYPGEEAQRHAEILQDFVYSGFDVNELAGLDVQISPGVAYIKGYRVEVVRTGVLVDRCVNGTVEARGDNPPNESKEKAFDDDINTKWLDFSPTSWIQYHFAEGEAWPVTKYTITTAYDAPERDPKNWYLKASHDGVNWVILDERRNVSWSSRLEKKEFEFENQTAYEYYRLEITENWGGGECQIGEIEFMSSDPNIRKTLADNATNHIFLTKDASDEGSAIVVNTSGAEPSNSIKLAEVVTSNGSISSIVDRRPLCNVSPSRVLIYDDGVKITKLSDLRAKADQSKIDASNILIRDIVTLANRATIFILDYGILDLDRLG